MRATLWPVLLLTTIAVAGPAKDILGKWYRGDGASVEFRDDGTAVLANGKFALVLKWKIVGRNRLHLEAQDVVHVYEIVVLAESKLITKDKEGELETLTRSKWEPASPPEQ